MHGGCIPVYMSQKETSHYLVDIASGDVLRGAPNNILRALWALAPSPFAVEATVEATYADLAAITRLGDARTIRAGIASLEETGLIERTATGRRGLWEFTVRRPDRVGGNREICEPFTPIAAMEAIGGLDSRGFASLVRDALTAEIAEQLAELRLLGEVDA
jgi:hypothetical protein